MGYSHYWYLDKTNSNQDAYESAKKDIIKIIQYKKNILANGIGENEAILEPYISFNGIGDKSCETFFLPENLKDLDNEDYFPHRDNKNLVFNSCKTRYCPYDEVVTACLTVLFYHLAPHDLVIITSDGNPEEWDPGVKLAEEILKIDLFNPLDRDILNLLKKRRNQTKFIKKLKNESK